jgi:hypothetical protein
VNADNHFPTKTEQRKKMNSTRTFGIRSALVVAGLALLFNYVQAAEEPSWRELFNGKDLSGWDGNPELWSVKDGVIVGQTAGPEQLKYNQFLIWRGGVVKNFELRATVRQSGNNSGIQYRSVERKDVGPWSISGYQCDIHPQPNCTGMCYEERGRGVLFSNGQTGVVDDQGQKYVLSQNEPRKIDVTQWHEYAIVAVGNKLTHKIDGQVMSELTDHDLAKRSLEGLLAIQIHAGPAMKVEIKDIRLKALPDGSVVTLDQEPLPPTAKLVERPQRKAPSQGKQK